ncbi:MAG: DUF6768 family protein [Erythrobacter sp.]
MTTTDNRIAEALSDDDRAFLDELERERGMFEQIGDTLSGPLGGWAKFIFVIAFTLGIAMAYAAWQLFHATEIRETILWSVGLLAMLTAQGFIKEWFYNRMNMFVILREVKLLQVQVAILNEAKS